MWREAALAEVRGLKPHFVTKYMWTPVVTETNEAVDIVLTLSGKALGDRRHALRLRYLSDWENGGRRETFVDPEDHTVEGRQHWPGAGIRGVNPDHQPPCICLRGVYGYHSVLHTNERPTGTTLLGFLLELQAVIDE